MNYLIIRNDGVGDLILSTPLINKIKDSDINAKIYLICSDRNHNIAKLYKKNNYIFDYILFDQNKSKLRNILNILKLLRNNYFDTIFTLKASNFNYFLSLILHSKSKKYIVHKNKSKNGNIRFTPPLLLIKKKKYELIDCTNEYKDSAGIHMSDHFLNLYIQSSKYTSEKYYIPEIKNETKLSDRINPSFINKRFVIFHVDEKWNNIKNSKFIIIEIIRYFKSQLNINLLITSGLNKYIELKYIKKESNNVDNITYVDDVDIESLLYLASKASLVITCHGALTHISAYFKTPLIDLIDENRKYFFLKWRPRIRLSKQIDYYNIKKILETINDYLRL